MTAGWAAAYDVFDGSRGSIPTDTDRYMTLKTIFSALFTAGLPLFVMAFVLVALAFHRGWLVGDSVQEIRGSIEALGKKQKGRKGRRQFDPAMSQWFRFGGGFYGLVALYTWLLIEWADVADFLSDLGGIFFSFDPGAVFELALALFIESVMNFGLAIAWPAYWLAESRGNWLLFFAAYGGYWLGIKAAHIAWRRGWVSEAFEQVAVRLGRRGQSESR